MSMSHKSTPTDNAPIKSFIPTLKSETLYLDSLTSTTMAIVEKGVLIPISQIGTVPNL